MKKSVIFLTLIKKNDFFFDLIIRTFVYRVTVDFFWILKSTSFASMPLLAKTSSRGLADPNGFDLLSLLLFDVFCGDILDETVRGFN